MHLTYSNKLHNPEHYTDRTNDNGFSSMDRESNEEDTSGGR